VSLGDSASGEELGDALRRLGGQRHEFASQLWGELSNQQKISVYLNKIDSFLRSAESANLSVSQIDFIENSKNIMRRAFEENWHGNEDEYLYFSMQTVEVLGLKIAGDIYGARALWPRTPTTIDITQENTSSAELPQCDCSRSHQTACNYSPNMCASSAGRCEAGNRDCGVFGVTLCDGKCLNIQ